MEKVAFTIVRTGTSQAGNPWIAIAHPDTEKEEIQAIAYILTKKEMKVGTKVQLIKKYAENLEWGYR